MRKKYLLLALLFTGITFASVAQNTCQKAKMAFENGEYENAINYYSVCQRDFDTDSTDIKKAIQCRNFLAIADDAFAGKDYVKAAEKYKALLAVNPADRHAKEHYNRCIAEINPRPIPVGSTENNRKRENSNKTTPVNTTKTGTFQIDTKTTDITEPPLKRFHFGMVGFGASVSNIETNSWLYEKEQNPRIVGMICYPVDLLFEYKLNRYLSFQPELQFIMKGAHGKAYTSDLYYDTQTGDYLSNVLVEDTINLNYLELPLNLVLNIPVSKTTDFFIGAGYYLAYGVYGKLKLSPSKEGYSFEEEESEDVFSGDSEILKLNRFDRGINCMLGFRIYFDKEKNDGSFFIRAGYEWSLENMSFRRGRNAETFKNNCFYISMGVFL